MGNQHGNRPSCWGEAWRSGLGEKLPNDGSNGAQKTVTKTGDVLDFLCFVMYFGGFYGFCLFPNG